MESGIADTVLLIGAEVFSRILDFTDRQTCVLFGDGAGATVIQASDRPGIEGTVLGADGTAAEILLMPGGGSREPATAGDAWPPNATASRCRTAGRSSSARSPRWPPPAARCSRRTGITPDDVDLLIPHQANARIMIAVAERLQDPARARGDRRRGGRATRRAASIPIALDRAYRAGRMREGDLVVFTIVRRRASRGAPP